MGEHGVIMPPPLPLTSEKLERHGLFLIEDGQTIFLWVGRDAVPQLIIDVFNLPSYEVLRGGKVSFFNSSISPIALSPPPPPILSILFQTTHCCVFFHLTQTTLPVLDNPFSQRVNAIVQKTREMRRGPYWPHLYIVKEDGEPPLRLWALSCLIQDRADVLPSYQQFIGQLKDKVRSIEEHSSIV